MPVDAGACARAAVIGSAAAMIEEEADSAARVRPGVGRAFVGGVVQGLVITGFVLGIMIALSADQNPEGLTGAILKAVGFGLGGALVGGIRSMLVSRHAHWAPRMAIGAVGGAVLGALVGLGIVVSLAGPNGAPSMIMVGWCAGCFGLILGLRTLQYDS